MKRPAFAPGVIECHRRQHARALIRWMSRAAVLLIACGAAYLKGGAL